MRNPISEQVELLSPHQKRREPFFGAGAGSLLAHLLTIGLGLLIFLAVLFLAIYAKQVAQRFVYGEPPHATPILEPGQSTTIDGVIIKRIN